MRPIPLVGPSILLGIALAMPLHGAVLCARPRKDGTLSSTVKVREGCVGREVELGLVSLEPLRVVGPPTTTTTSSTTTTSTVACSTCIADVFIPTTPVETVTVPFIAPETHTATSYSGLVAVSVFGSGQGAGGARFNDAFYLLGPIEPYGSGSAFVVSFSPNFCSGGCCPVPGLQLAHELMVFAEGIGDVTAPYSPPFAADHAYRFVLNLGSFVGPLTLANFDCGLGDNSGDYIVTLTGVQRR